MRSRKTGAAPFTGAGLALLLSTSALAQGVPVHDPVKNAREAQITAQMEADLAMQRRKDAERARINQAEGQRREALGRISDGMTLPEGGQSALQMIAGLEAGTAPAGQVYAAGNSPAADRLFGDGRENVEQIIIRAARDTHHLQKAGLSLVQWRCWLQALIWQESRFNPHAQSPVGAYGLTQIMPATAGDLGIAATYRSDPYVQAEGGARYLAQRLNEFDGDMILALAAYNAGAGNVRKHGGVPPFAETRKYVEVIPRKYAEYMTRIGAADQIGIIEPSYVANAERALIGGAVMDHASDAAMDMDLAMARLDAVIARLPEAGNAAEAMALNSYLRAEFARLLVVRTRLVAARARPMSAEQVAAASAFAQERRFMDFKGEF
ncbi:lytic transglycosylase domain-containing protein [Paracoccus aestuarii]|uniref:Lytic transglycosylase domain-containing protein n=1 Tax=Paracoccus aestuarii TaxID=453842 RepID=A0A418ZY66_9RHOB|nr:lytic transglycosylase domain-containing protein [Paracoccus aestuarii]RJL05470.1 lytic transglycosylase domain-containing protein [Paracoccus aestuarii]WCR01287.1 lytic transglycosylase domain-containing protein [Paracoccus aestuarii]